MWLHQQRNYGTFSGSVLMFAPAHVLLLEFGDNFELLRLLPRIGRRRSAKAAWQWRWEIHRIFEHTDEHDHAERDAEAMQVDLAKIMVSGFAWDDMPTRRC